MLAPKVFAPSGKVPYSLGIQRTYETDAPVPPFPSFEENQSPNGILSAISVVFDKCGRLWILDNVVSSIFEPEPSHRIQIFAYDVKAKRMVFNYQFPRKVTSPGPNSVTRLVIDDYYGCDNIRAIVADSIKNCIYIFDYKTQSSWQVNDDSFKNIPEYSSFQYRNNTLFLPGGVFSTSLSPPIGKHRTRYLFYSSYSGITIYTFPLSILYRRELWTKGVSLWKPYTKAAWSYKIQKGNTFINKLQNTFGKREEQESEDHYEFIDVHRYFNAIGSSEMLVQSYCDMDVDNGIYYCALPRERGISAWPIDKPISEMRIVARNTEHFESPVIIRVVKNLQGEIELVMSTAPVIVRKNYLNILKIITNL